MLAGLLLLGCAVPGTAVALLGWHEAGQNVTRAAAVEKRLFKAEVVATRLQTIYLSGDARRIRTAGFGFDFVIDSGLWALCATTVGDPSDSMVGSCVDCSQCSKGCGFTDRSTLPTVSW